jgi:hypothetical protein
VKTAFRRGHEPTGFRAKRGELDWHNKRMNDKRLLTAQVFGASKNPSVCSAFKPKLLPKTSVTSGGMFQSYEARLKKQPLCDENILSHFEKVLT